MKTSSMILPNSYYEAMDNAIAHGPYNNRSEIIREALRDFFLSRYITAEMLAQCTIPLEAYVSEQVHCGDGRRSPLLPTESKALNTAPKSIKVTPLTDGAIRVGGEIYVPYHEESDEEESQ